MSNSVDVEPVNIFFPDPTAHSDTIPIIPHISRRVAVYAVVSAYEQVFLHYINQTDLFC